MARELRRTAFGPRLHPGKQVVLSVNTTDGGPPRECTEQENYVSEGNTPVVRGTSSNTLQMRARAATADSRQILKDLPRTFCDHPEVIRHAAVIESVLLEYAVADPEVGYCQGMNCVAAVISAQFPDPQEAFKRFQAIVWRMRGLWLPGLPLFITGMAAFEAMYQKQLPMLYSHMVKHSVTFDMFLPDTWLTLFSRWLPFVLLWQAFELLEAEGFPGVLSLTAALLQTHATALTETDDFTSLFVLLKELGKQPQQPEGSSLLISARALLPSAKQALQETTDPEPRVKLRTQSEMSCMSIQRQGSRIIHDPTGLELLKEDVVGEWNAGREKMNWMGIAQKMLKGPQITSPKNGVAAGDAGTSIRITSGTTIVASERSVKKSRQRSFGCLPCGRTTKTSVSQPRSVS